MHQRIVRLFLLVLVFFSLSVLPGRAQGESAWTFEKLESSSRQLLVELRIPSFAVETITQDGLPYQRLAIDGWGSWGQPGRPELPAFSVMVGMPWPGDPQISVIEVEREVLPGYRLYPNPDYVVAAAPQGPDLVERFTLDAASYSTDADYPGSLTEMIDKGYLHDQPLFRLRLYPFQYNPVRQELTFIRRMKILITFPAAAISGTSAEIEPTPVAFRKILEQMLVNYAALPQSELSPPVDDLQGTSATGAKYLIITHPDFYDAVQELAAYRTGQGLSAKTVKTNDIYDQYSSGVKSAEAIRDYLENAYTTWNPKPEYVLLVGDADASAVITNPENHREIIGYNPNVSSDYLPTHYEATLVFIDEVGPAPIDAWYAKLTKENGAYDPHPDVILGRIPARSASQVKTVIAKVKAYELSPESGPWARRAVLVADDGTNQNPDEGKRFASDMNFIASLLPASIAPTKMYNYNPSTSVQNEVDEGVLILAYSGHGNKDGWASWADGGTIYKKSRINNMSNGNKLPFIIVANCSNGYFAASDTARVMAEEFLLIANKGGVASFAPAAFSFPSVNTLVTQELAKAIFNQGDQILGSAATTARWQAHLNDEFNINLSLFEIFTYFGDPALRLYVPPTLSLAGQSLDNTVIIGQPVTYKLHYSVSGAEQARGLTLVNTLPNHVTYQSASVTPTSVNDRTVTWDLEDVPQGNYNITINAVVNTTGLLDGQIIVNEARLYDIHGGDRVARIDTEVVSNDVKPKIASIISSSPDTLGQTTQFASISDGTNLTYNWDFDDGNISTEKSPSHTYTDANTYGVTLTISNSAGNDSKTIEVVIKPAGAPVDEPIASFLNSSPDQLGQTTSFINTSQDGGDEEGKITHSWDFGDGKTSKERDPLHTYQEAGIYTVRLLFENSAGSDTSSDMVIIEAPPPKRIFLPLIVKATGQ